MSSGRRPWAAYGLLAVGVLAFAVTLSTRNDWDQAPVCAGPAADSGDRCVTEKRGTVVKRGYRSCTTPTAWGMGGCTSLPVDIRFADGSRRHFEFNGDRLDEFLSGGNRDESVVPRAYGPEGSDRVVGRFHGRHLVELRFPAGGGSLATDDYPNSGVNTAAFFAMFVSPLAAGFAWLLSATGVGQGIVLVIWIAGVVMRIFSWVPGLIASAQLTEDGGLFTSLLAFFGVTLAVLLAGELLVRGANRLDTEGNLTAAEGGEQQRP